MPDVEKDIGEIWTLYGHRQLGRAFDLPGLDGWAWDIPQAGPGIDAFEGPDLDAGHRRQDRSPDPDRGR